ncbi:MAG: porin [Polaromonas sp.]|nr:porin [Polaromonas sp.]
MRSKTFIRMLTPVALALLTAGLAHAQEKSGSSVSLYGVVDACLVSYKGATGSDLRVNGGGCFYGSRFGLRGSEDLGSGLKATFALESGFAIDTGTMGQGGRLFGRRSTVGLSGGFGTLELGRELPPNHFLISSIDPMQLGVGSASATLWTGSPSTSSGRSDNSVIYATPAFGGFVGRVQLSPGEQTAPLSPRGGHTTGFTVTYRDKQLLTGGGYATVRNPAGNGTDRAATAGAKYDFGGFSLAALAQFGAWEGSRTVATPSSATALYSRDYRSYVVGGTIKFGTNSLSGTYKRYDDRTASNFDANVVSAVFIHPLSKRTQIYTGLSRLKNVRGSSYGAADGNGAYAGSRAGGSSRIVDLGITHFF